MVHHAGNSFVGLRPQFTTHPSSSTPMYLPKRTENMFMQRSVYKFSLTVLFIIAKILEVTPVASAGEWIQEPRCPYDGILLQNDKERATRTVAW